ncbi:MAG: hybrid sensor histidine kinase/response regulator [Opitutaceae bacterium]
MDSGTLSSSVIQARRTEALADAAAQLLSAQDPEALLGGIFAQTGRQAGAAGFCLHLLDADSAEPRFATGAGMDDYDLEALEQGLRHPGLLGSVVKQRIPIVLDDLANSRDDAARNLAALGVSCCALLPLRVEGRGPMHGAVAFVAVDFSAFDEDAMQFLQAATNLAATSLERAALISEMRRAREDAEAALRSRDEFLAVLSRELRTPLNPILLIASDAAENQALPAAVRKDFASIRNNIRLETRLIDELLDLTRVTRGGPVLASEDVDLHAILLDVLRAAKEENKEKAIRMHRDFSAAKACVRADPARIRQVFWNLLENAFKFTPEEGAITVFTSNPEDTETIDIQIVDTGIGMAREELDAVFEPFRQGGEATLEARTRFGGLGLGLAITRMLVNAHGGTIEADSPGLGLGAKLLVTLPISQADPDQTGRARSTRDSDKTKADARASDRTETLGRRVLVVDDHAPTRSALSLLLKRRRYVVTVAAGATEALEKARNGEFDLLLSDLGLPDGNGFSVMRLVKDIHPEIRGIAISGYGTDSDLERSRRAGFSAHLVKPVSIKALEKTLAQVSATLDAHGNA